VTAFGVNAIVLPPGYETGRHFHDQQEELYFCHPGRMEIKFGDGARVDAGWARRRDTHAEAGAPQPGTINE
jgi:uncharacterized cupin superfamily protein